MSFQLFAWIASIAFGFETVVGKLTSKYELKNPWHFIFVWELVVTILIIPIALVKGISAPQGYTSLIVASLFSALAGIFWVLALYRLDVSVFSPLFNFRTVFSALLAFFIIGELLTLEQYLLILVIFVGGILVSMDEKLSIKSFFNKGVAVALLMMLSLALMSIYQNISVAQNGYWSAMFWIRVMTQPFMWLTIPLFYKDVLKTPVKQYSGILILSVLGTIGTIASLKATAVNVSISSAIISLPTSMIIAFILSIVKPKLLEKHTLKVYAIRFAAATVMIVSVLGL